jgi:hypothetical protein
VFKTFGRAHARVLLHKQDEIAELQDQLDELNRNEINCFHLTSRRRDRSTERKEVLEKLADCSWSTVCGRPYEIDGFFEDTTKNIGRDYWHTLFRLFAYPFLLFAHLYIDYSYTPPNQEVDPHLERMTFPNKNSGPSGSGKSFFRRNTELGNQPSQIRPRRRLRSMAILMMVSAIEGCDLVGLKHLPAPTSHPLILSRQSCTSRGNLGNFKSKAADFKLRRKRLKTRFRVCSSARCYNTTQCEPFSQLRNNGSR